MTLKCNLFAAAALIGLSQFASAANPFNSFDAAQYNVYGAGVDGVISLALGQYGNFTTQQLVERPSAAAALSDEEIAKVVALVEDSPFNKFGHGLVGGNRVAVEYDAQQVARMAGVKNAAALRTAYAEAGQTQDPTLTIKEGPAGLAADESAAKLGADMQPKFEVREFNTRTVTSIEAELKALQTAGASVKSITFRGLLARSGGKAVGTLQLLFIGGALSNTAIAGYNAVEADRNIAWQCQADGCQQPSVLQYLFNTSNAVFYSFKAQ